MKKAQTIWKTWDYINKQGERAVKIMFRNGKIRYVLHRKLDNFLRRLREIDKE